MVRSFPPGSKKNMGFLNFTLRGFKQPQEIIADTLGKLEQEALEAIWFLGDASVREVYQQVGGKYAYTTLMTTLDRLHKKGLLKRRKVGRAFYYRQAFSPRELETGIVSGVIEGLLGRRGGKAEPILACIVDAVSERDQALLDELERLVQEKKRELEEA
jgi:predicted transcriptional regulator